MLSLLQKIYTLLPRSRKRQLLLLAFGMIVMSFIELCLTGAISLLGVALAEPASLEKIKLLWKFFQLLPVFGESMPASIRMLILVLSMVCIATVFKNIFTAFTTYWQNLLSQRISWDMGKIIFDNYLYAPYIWHTQMSPVDLSGYLAWRAYVAQFFMGALQLASQLTIMCFLMAGAFTIAPMVSALLYGVTAFIALLIYKTSQHRARELGEELAQLGIGVGRVIHFGLHGIREVQIYEQQKAFNKHFSFFAEPTTQGSAKQSLYIPLPQWILETTGMGLLLAAILILAQRGESVASITGTLTLMAAISWRLLPALNKIVGGVLQLKSSINPVQILFSNFIKLPRLEMKNTRRPFSHAVDLRDVSFRYPEATSDALQNVNLSITKGNMVGIIGLSGAGKSTLVGILTGLLKADAGKVLVDGQEVKPCPGFLRIGYVPQSPYIIDASLAENVAFCDWGRKPDEEKVLRCCKMAAIDFLDELPKSLHTVLGDRGMRLSGGQVQRVAIARALYCEPDILLFDEATSALDGAAEASIQNTILNLRKDMTIVIVAHRLSTIQGCDVLYWLQNGKVKRYGPSEEVLVEYENFLSLDNINKNFNF